MLSNCAQKLHLLFGKMCLNYTCKICVQLQTNLPKLFYRLTLKKMISCNKFIIIYFFLFLLSQYVKEKVNSRKVQDVHITQNCTLWYKGYRDAIVAYLLILTQFFRRLKNPCIRCRRIFPF